MSDSLTLRIRTKIGVWRLNQVSSKDTFRVLRERLEKEHNVTLDRNLFTVDPAGARSLPDEMTVSEAKLNNGHMIYINVDESKVGVHESSSSQKKITKDGKIVTQDTTSVLQKSGFRPGMLPLRSMKMQWTLNEFVALDEQFVYKIKAQEKSGCALAMLDSEAVKEFQSYMRNFDFGIIRVGYLYGKLLEDNKVKVEIIYEPPQDCTETSFTLLEDPQAETVEAIAQMLGLRRVGWIFAHPAREKGFFFSGPEILFAAEQQLESIGGVGDTSFVTVKVTIDEKSQIIVDAYQVSKQCMEMVAEGVLQVSKNLGSCSVNSTFTAVVEGRNTQEVDNNFFLVTTPIQQCEADFLVSMFPRANRIDKVQSRDDIKKQLSKAGKQGWTFTDLLADFHLLLYLSKFLSIQDDIPEICKTIMEKDNINEGYQLLLRSLAGIE